MSEDQFNKRIKEKLDGYKPAYQEKAWERLSKSLVVPWHLQFLKNYGAYLLAATFSTIAFLGSYLYFKTKNQNLFEENITLKTQTKEDSILSANNTSFLKKDTVFNGNENDLDALDQTPTALGEKVYVEKPSKIIRFSQTPKPKNQTSENNTNKDILSKNRGSINEINRTSNYTQNVPAKTNVNTMPLNKVVTTEEALKKTAIIDLPINTKRLSETITTNPAKNTKLQEITKNKQSLNDKTKRLVFSPKLITYGSNPIKKTIIKPTYTKPLSRLKTKQKANINWPKIEAKVGLMGNLYGLKRIAVGPAVEVLLAKNLSLNTAVLFSSQQPEFQGKTDDFNKKTGLNFKKEFKKHLKDKPEETIEEVDLSTSFIKMPLYLSYQLKTNTPFSFVLSAGTNLNLKVHQEVNYISNHKNKGERAYFENTPDTKLINGLFYGMGLQYRHKRFYAQISPYFDFEFRENKYIDLPTNFGSFATIKFDINK